MVILINRQTNLSQKKKKKQYKSNLVRLNFRYTDIKDYRSCTENPTHFKAPTVDSSAQCTRERNPHPTRVLFRQKQWHGPCGSYPETSAPPFWVTAGAQSRHRRLLRSCIPSCLTSTRNLSKATSLRAEPCRLAAKQLLHISSVHYAPTRKQEFQKRENNTWFIKIPKTEM